MQRLSWIGSVHNTKYARRKHGLRWLNALKMSLNSLGFIESLSRHGDVVFFDLGRTSIVLVNDPELILTVLMDDHGNLGKGRVLQVAKHLLGEGLLTSEGESHRQRRRLMQPTFRRDRVPNYAEAIIAATKEAEVAWQDGSVLDIAQEMGYLTLRITGRTLFHYDVKDETEIREAFGEALACLRWMMLPALGTLAKSLPPLKQRFRAAKLRLDNTIYRLIAEHKGKQHEENNLLSLLLRNQEAGGEDSLTDAQVRDEAMTILLAGHETMANALTWTWHLLSQNPEVEAKLHDELDRVLDGRGPCPSDIPQLRYTTWTLAESMRLRPPAWGIGRKALRDFNLGSHHIPAGTMVMLCQYTAHRSPEYFESPEKFEPDRWRTISNQSLPKLPYFPFGGGSRVCIGESLAWMEATLILAYLASHWRLRVVARHPVEMQPFITLRPKYGVKMTLTRRSGNRSANPMRTETNA